MSWWIAIGLGYLLVCGVGWGAVLLICPGTLKTEHRLNDALAFHPVRMRIGLMLAAVIVGPLLPAILLGGAWICRRYLRELNKFGRTYRPIELVPLHAADLPAQMQPHIERSLPALERLGFASAVCGRFKPEPKPVFALCLLSPEGETVAGIEWIYGTPAVSFVSVLESGHVLETGCCEAVLPDEKMEAINRSGRFTVQMFEPQADEEFLGEVYYRHLERLAELEERLGCGTLHLAADQVPALKRYENAVFGEIELALDWIDNRPSPERPPVGIARKISFAQVGV